LGQKPVGNGKYLRFVEIVEPAGDFSCQFDMGELILTDRNAVGAVDDNIGGLQDRIAQESIGPKVFLIELLLLFLVGWISLEPGKRGNHRE
jgi:hypothetical protein